MAKKKLVFNVLTGKFDLITKSLISSEITDFTEAAQDATGSAINAGTQDGVSVSYNDAANKIDFTNTDKGSSAVATHVGQSDPHTQYLKESDNLLIDPQVIRVKISNAGAGEFTDLALAVASITDSDPDTKPYVISLGAGVHVANNPIILPSGVSVYGEDINATRIVPLDPNEHLFVMGNMCEIAFLNLKGITGSIGSGKAAIYCEDVGDFAQIHKVSIYDFDIGIENFSNTSNSTVYSEYTDINGDFTYAVKNTAVSPQANRIQLENFYSYPSNGTSPTHIYSTGQTSELIINSAGLFGGAGNLGVNIGDGCIASISDTFIKDFTGAGAIGLVSANTGLGPILDISGVSLSNNTKDISIDNPNTDGSLNVVADKTKVTINTSTSMTIFISDSLVGGITTLGELNYSETNFSNIVNIAPLIISNATMGVFSGGTLTDGGGLVLNVAAIKGYTSTGTSPNDIIKYWQLAAQTITLSADSDEYIYINSSGVLVKNPSSPDTKENILLGRVVTDSAVLYIENASLNSEHYSNRIDRVFREAIGPIYAHGSLVSENGTRGLNITAGEYYYSETEFITSSGTAISWDAFYRSATVGLYTKISGQSTVSNSDYDDGSGTLASIPVNKYAKFTLYILGGGTDKYLLVYPQAYYNTQAEAEGAPLALPPNYVTGAFARVASLVVQQGHVNFLSILDERPRIGFASSSTAGGVTAHSALSGLGANDHNQYLLRDGSNIMVGILNMNSNAITNAASVNGVIVEAHASRHAFNGVDPFLSAVPQSVGSSNAEGVDNTHFSRADHVHAHGNLGGGATHAAVTTTVNGYMSAADKVKLDAISAVVSAVTASAPLSSSGGLTPDISITRSSTSVDGYLAATDFVTFNNKQNAGNYITALTGDGTASGPNSAIFTLATVNTNIGSFGSASSVGSFTVNAKGLITAAAAVTIAITSTNVTDFATAASAAAPVQSIFGRTGSVIAATNDYTWAQIDKTTSSFADITTRSATDINSGTLADARLTSNVALKNIDNAFSVSQTINVTGASSILNIAANGSTTNIAKIVFTGTASNGDFQISGDGGDIFWQGGGSRNLQMAAYHGMDLLGGRTTGTSPTFLAGTGSAYNTRVLNSNDSIGLIVKANGTQTANLVEVQNSAGSALAGFTSTGIAFGVTPTAAAHLTTKNYVDTKSIAGDVTGTLASSVVSKIQTVNVSSTTPLNGQSLAYNSATLQWEPQTVGGGSGVTVVSVSASALSLTSSSNTYQLFTGATHGQTVILPDATTLAPGTDYFLVNESDTIIPIYFNGGNLACTLYPDQYLECLVVDISTSAGKWLIETAVPNPMTQIQLFDDFMSSRTTSGAIGNMGWTLVTGTTTVQASTGIKRGVVRVNSTAANNGTVAIHLGLNNILTTNGIIVYEAYVSIPVLGGTLANARTSRFGIGDTTGNADQANGIYFEYAGTAAGTINWSLKTASASTRTTVNSGVAVAAATFYKLSFVLNSVGNSVGFYIDNVHCGTITTNIPTAAMGNLIHTTTNATNIAAKTCDVDYVYMTNNFNVVR